MSKFHYDGLNRRIFAGFASSGSSYESTIGYTYDAGNRITQAVDSVAGTITRAYDGLNRLTSETTPQGGISYGYDAANRRTSMTVAGQSAVSYSYDDANRVVGLSRGTASVAIAYDADGRRTSLTLPNGIVESFGYDGASQLSGINYQLGSTNVGNLTYSYDIDGRRIAMGGSMAHTGIPATVSTTTYNVANQLTQWGTASLYYDLNGNMTSDGTNSFTWDARNQLASMNFTSDSFQYDAFGRRTGKTISSTTTGYLYDGANIAQELSGTTPTANLLSGGIDEVFTRTDSSGTANFLTDALGSTLAVTDGSGSALASYAYEPFGNTTVSGSSANTYEYTGRENDGTGLYFDRGRYYSPTSQRFISEDPIGMAGGIDLYTYTGNNPISFSDPFGRDKRGKGWGRGLLDYLWQNAASGCGKSIEDICKSTIPGPFGSIEGGFEAAESEAAQAAEGGAEQPKWNLGDNKSAQKWQNQMQQRGWTPQQIDDAIANGQKFDAPNNINPGNGATRYVNPQTGRSVVVDNKTGQVIHVGGDGFKY